MLSAIQNVCVDIDAVVKGSESLPTQKKKSKEPAVQQLVTKPVRPSLTQVFHTLDVRLTG